MDDENSVRKSIKDCETPESSNCRKKRGKAKCSSKPHINHKRFKEEVENIEMNPIETEQYLPIDSSKQKENTQRKSKRLKNQHPDAVRCISNEGKTDWLQNNENFERYKTTKNPSLNLISDKIIKNLDNIFFPEDINDKINNSDSQIDTDSKFHQKNISASPKNMNDLLEKNTVDNTHNLIEIEDTNDFITRRGLKEDKQFLLNKIQRPIAALYEGIKKNTENCETDEGEIIKNEKDTCEKLTISTENKNEKNENNDTKRQEIYQCEEGKSKANIICAKELERHTAIQGLEEEQNKKETTMPFTDTGSVENLSIERLKSKQNIKLTESAMEITNEVSSFQLNSAEILMDELFSDIKKADAIISVLINGKDKDNHTANGDITNFPLRKSSLHSKNDNAQENVEEKCRDDKQDSENNMNYKTESDGTYCNKRYKSQCYEKQTLEENVFVSRQIDNGNVLNGNNEEVVSGSNLELQCEKIIVEEIPLDDVKLKSAREFLDESTISSSNNFNEETNFSKGNMGMCEANSENKQSVPQINSNDTCIINGNTIKEENTQEIDTSDSLQENLESKERKLTLLYMNALDYAKYQLEGGDGLNDEKRIHDSEDDMKLSNDFQKDDTPDMKKMEFREDSKENKSAIQKQNTMQTASADTNLDMFTDVCDGKIKTKNCFRTQDLTDKITCNEIQKSNVNEKVCYQNGNESLCHQIQIYGESESKDDLTGNTSDLSVTHNTQQLQTLACNRKAVSPSQPNNSVCGTNCHEKCEEDDVMEKKTEEADGHSKNKCLEIPEMSFLVTATDYFKVERKDAEISKETKLCNTDIEPIPTDKKGENNKSCSDAEDSFDMDDDFDLTASQLSMIDIDERNHFKELNQTKENFSKPKAENCSSTHFNPDSITVEIIDQLCYIRESVESIKELLNTFIKQK